MNLARNNTIQGIKVHHVVSVSDSIFVYFAYSWNFSDCIYIEAHISIQVFSHKLYTKEFVYLAVESMALCILHLRKYVINAIDCSTMRKKPILVWLYFGILLARILRVR